MGPIIIFDKSFLQSISLDESVWLEQFFLTNIVPTFFAETLADIEKEPNSRQRHPIDVISDLSKRTPQMGATSNVDYLRLVLGNLMGQEVEMNPHRPIIDGGQYKRTPEGDIEIHYDKFPYTAALERWKMGAFIEVEKNLAKEWRRNLSQINLDSMIARVTNIVPKTLELKSLNDIKEYIDDFMKKPDREALVLCLGILGIPFGAYKSIFSRWDKEKPKSLVEFAPYAVFVFKIQLLFYLAMERNLLIQKNRQSHIIDLSYIYYLPFCLIFTSFDKLHFQLAPLFMQKDQKFISGSDLKNGLSSLNTYYEQHRQEIEDMGTISFTAQPPKDFKNEVSDIWDFCFPNWRKSEPATSKNKDNSELLKHLKEKQKVSVPTDVPVGFKSDDAKAILFKNKIAVRKGSWRILPKGIENKKNNE